MTAIEGKTVTETRFESRGFGSDNHSGAHPAAIEAIVRANEGHTPAYGDDAWSAAATARFRALFGEDTDVFLTMTGTGANVIGLGSVTGKWDAVICPSTAHINVDECSAPEVIAGVKLVPVPTPGGKLTPDIIAPELKGFDFEHQAQPKVISISQASEYGTVYTADEVRALADTVHQHGMLVHMDGARLANAAAHLGTPVREFTVDSGVDVLCFGGTKNGMAFGEAVLFFGDARTDAARYIRKQSTQLASKMRYVGAQFEAMLEGDLWLEVAEGANRMAKRLAQGVSSVAGCQITQPTEANEVFAVMPAEVIEPLQTEFHFYTWNDSTHEVRLVCSWDTTEQDVDALVDRLQELVR